MRYEQLSEVVELARSQPAAPVVRLVALHGFGGGERDLDLAVLAEDQLVGGILGAGLAAGVSRDGTPRIERLDLDDDRAQLHGLACGGWAEVMVHPVGWLAGLEAFLAGRVPVVVETELGDRGPLQPRIARDDAARPGVSLRGTLHRHAFVPTPRFVVVGEGALADELRWVVQWLGAQPVQLPAGVLGPLDGVCVLSHDHDVATPVLRDALQQGAGYVAALGSRETQRVRAERLREAGVDPGALYGPAGFDIGARSARETALAIAAEWLAVTRRRSGRSLRDGDGPING